MPFESQLTLLAGVGMVAVGFAAPNSFIAPVCRWGGAIIVCAQLFILWAEA